MRVVKNCQVIFMFIRRKAKVKRASLRFEVYGGIRKYSNGREVCQDTKLGRFVYRNRVLAMLLRQHFRCCNCGNPLHEDEATFEHENGRTAGKRDDRIEIDGQRINGASHGFCNVERGSKRTPLRYQ